MLIGARTAAWSGEKLPYPRTGLVCCYDGIWNGGIGVHNSTGLTWKDLSSNGFDAEYNGSQSDIEWGLNYCRNWYTQNNSYGFLAPISSDASLLLNSEMTVIFANGKTDFGKCQWGWPFLINNNADTEATGIQWRGGDVGFHTHGSFIGRSFDISEGNVICCRYLGKTLQSVFVDHEDKGITVTGARDFDNQIHFRMELGWSFNMYVCLLYNRVVSDEELFKIEDVINARFGLT